jgi:Protein of unknown function (DUF2933)
VAMRTRSFILMLLTAILSAAAFWLLREHWGHVLGYAPYLLFLACPLLHLFHGHGGRDHGRGASSTEPGSGAN